MVTEKTGITIRHAYLTMFRFLLDRWEASFHSDLLASLLSDVDPYRWVGEGVATDALSTGDPATWHDWIHSVQAVYAEALSKELGAHEQKDVAPPERNDGMAGHVGRIMDGDTVITVGAAWTAMVAYLRSRWEAASYPMFLPTVFGPDPSAYFHPIASTSTPLWEEWTNAVSVVTASRHGGSSGSSPDPCGWY